MEAKDIIATYEQFGPTWAKQRSGDLMERQWLDRMLAYAPRDTGAIRVLDLGCGAGRPIGNYLADRGVALTGVDAAAAMTALYRENIQHAGVITADMRGLNLAQHFDAILAWDSLFHLSPDDQRSMFATFAAHAAPGAVLMFTSGHTAGEAIGDIAGAPMYHASLDPQEYRKHLTDNGFKIHNYTPEDPNCGHHTIWFTQFKSA